MEVVGADRILFASDYPFIPMNVGTARRFLKEADLPPAQSQAIASGNWDRVRAGIRR